MAIWQAGGTRATIMAVLEGCGSRISLTIKGISTLFRLTATGGGMVQKPHRGNIIMPSPK